MTFDMYCNTHTKANNELDRYQANVDPEPQVANFIKGVRADARINPHLLPIKAIMIANPESKRDLLKAVTLFKDMMRQLMGTSSDREQRQVSARNC
jgi:hypothetical protein